MFEDGLYDKVDGIFIVLWEEVTEVDYVLLLFLVCVGLFEVLGYLVGAIVAIVCG